MKIHVIIFLVSWLCLFPLLFPSESRFYETSPTLTGTAIILNSDSLIKQIDAILDYFQKYKKQDTKAIHAGLFPELGINLVDVENTLRFFRDTISADLEKGSSSRLEDPGFWQTHFRFIKWRPQPQPADSLCNDKIKITKYAVFTVNGSLEKKDPFNYALYRLPTDEHGLTLQEAEKRKNSLNRFRYTRQQIFNGVYDRGGAEPLAWLTQQGLEEALLEGTICVVLADGSKKFFNVDRANDILYDTAKSPRNQQRYWYFGQVQHPQGYGLDIHSQVPIYPGAAIAGDVYCLGLGKIMGIVYNVPGYSQKKMLMGILADTGGAFHLNLSQLDYYLGVLPSRKEFNQLIKKLPEFADVYFIIKK